jgi:2-iminobutanoate/2-iminopropanoate deaminase
MRIKIDATGAPKATGPFSHAIIADGLVFTAGQIHLTAEGALLGGTIEEKAHQVMKNLETILKASDVSFADVVKTTIYMTDMSSYSKINEVYGSYMTDPYPAREAVCVKELPLGAEVEISMVAVKK